MRGGRGGRWRKVEYEVAMARKLMISVGCDERRDATSCIVWHGEVFYEDMQPAFSSSLRVPFSPSRTRIPSTAPTASRM